MPPEYPQVLLQNRKPDRIATLEEYQQSGGYQRFVLGVCLKKHCNLTSRIAIRTDLEINHENMKGNGEIIFRSDLSPYTVS